MATSKKIAADGLLDDPSRWDEGEGPEDRRHRTRVAFIHPDLGIGGAERLVVDAALGLKALGHEVEILTSYHDPNHCFEATRDGSLVVRHVKSLFPRSIYGFFHLPMAIARQLSLVFQLVVALWLGQTLPKSLLSKLTTLPADLVGYDVFIVDQLSMCVPLLRLLLKTRVVFYCHFPDKDVGESLARQRAEQRGQSRPSIIRSLYRLPLDLLEEGTIGASDKILVNSQFTSNQFVKSFFRLARIPRVVYPGIDLKQYNSNEVLKANAQLELDEQKQLLNGEEDGDHGVKDTIRALVNGETDCPMLLSINRFEAKKNIALAIDAFALIRRQRAAAGKTPLRLVIAGGYDRRVGDNVETLAALEKQCTEAGLSSQTLFYKRPAFEPPRSGPTAEEMRRVSVVFLPSLPGPLLSKALRNASTMALLYTPTNEHFGIVPLEAMAVGKPVVAVDAGGPLESVVDLGLRRSQVPVSGSNEESAASQTEVEITVERAGEGTGLLRRADARVWAGATLSLLDLLEDKPGFKEQLAEAAQRRVKEVFSVEAMSQKFDEVVGEVVAMGPVRPEEGLIQFGIAFGMFVLMSTCFLVVMVYADRREATKAREAQRTIAALQSQLQSQLRNQRHL